MAYREHILERSPYICAAGKLYDYSENVAACLKCYSLEDKVSALKQEAYISDKKNPFNFKQSKIENTRHCGVYTNMRAILQQPLKSRFQTIINDLKETTYTSYWDKPDGKRKDAIGKLPNNIDPYSTTFGKKVVPGITAKELVSPPKNYNQVYRESQQGHELYKKSHNNYDVNERVNRNYQQDSFNPNQVFGEKTAYDPRGIWVKCSMNSKNKDDLTVANKIQSDLLFRKVPKLGKSHSPNNNLKCTPEGHSFGKIDKYSYTVDEALSADESSVCNKDMRLYLAHINSLRLELKNRYNKNLFSFSRFLSSLRYYDEKKTGFIPLSTLHEVCICYKIFFDKVKIETFLNLMGIVDNTNNTVEYARFTELLNWKLYFPDIKFKCNKQQKNICYETTYNAAINDYKIIDNSKMDPAGMPTMRHDVNVPMVPNFGCKADIDNLGMDTDVGTIMYPSIYTSYGLSFFDFFQPRSKEQIRSIFETVGYELSNETFDDLWNQGCQHDKTGSICVDTFNKLLKIHNINLKNEISSTK